MRHINLSYVRTFCMVHILAHRLFSMADDSIQDAERSVWRIERFSSIYEAVSSTCYLHQEVTRSNRAVGFGHARWVNMGALSKMCWLAVCLQTFCLAICRGVRDARGSRRPVNDAFEGLMYIARLLHLVQRGEAHRMHVGVTRRGFFRMDRLLLDTGILTFHFSHLRARDRRFFNRYVRPQLLEEDAWHIGNFGNVAHLPDYPPWHIP